MQISKHFQSHELVAPEFHNSEFPDIWFISQWQIQVAEFFRERFGTTIINDYGFGGEMYAAGITYTMSGTRPPRENVIGSRWSQHKFMNALDLKFDAYTPDEVRDDMQNNPMVYLEQGITTTESGEIADTWVHVDGRLWGEELSNVQIVGS